MVPGLNVTLQPSLEIALGLVNAYLNRCIKKGIGQGEAGSRAPGMHIT